MAPVERVLVVGAGIGGLGAATALARNGIATDIVEIKPELSVYGVGINQPGNALRALDLLGLLDEVLSVGYRFGGWDFHDAEGNLLCSVDSQLGDDRVPDNIGLSRRDLHEILARAADRAGIRVQYGTTVENVATDADGAHVQFSDGRTGRYDVIAAFDGVKSAQRERVFRGAHRAAYAGVVIWRVTTPRPAEVTRGHVYQSVGAKAGLIPISADNMYLFLVTPEPEGTRVEKHDLPEMLRERLWSFAGPVGEIRDDLRADDDVVYSPLQEVMLPDPWFGDRTVICGDAAHACAPHLTQGAAMALEDAVVLAEELAGGKSPEAALAAFSTRRYRRAKFVQEASRGILDAEMSVTGETLPMALEGMRAAVPINLAQVDQILRVPA
jgi:2-polyprenyl-6-methoxyphenol hydroxylase-like FAD-dependent oxidoreductase